MTIDPGGGTEWMVDLEGWGSDLPVAGRGLERLENRTHLGRQESLAGGGSSCAGPESFSSQLISVIVHADEPKGDGPELCLGWPPLTAPLGPLGLLVLKCEY